MGELIGGSSKAGRHAGLSQVVEMPEGVEIDRPITVPRERELGGNDVKSPTATGTPDQVVLLTGIGVDIYLCNVDLLPDRELPEVSRGCVEVGAGSKDS